MSSAPPMPACLADNARVVLFDGVCHLCNQWVQFLLKRDPRCKLRLAAVQSPAGQEILAWAGLPTDQFDTMVFVENGRVYIKSEAFLRIVRRLPLPWPLLFPGVFVPRALRDWTYDCIAKNRYALFGKADSCMMPTPESAAHFLI